MPFYKIKTVYKRLLQLYLSIYAATHFWTRKEAELALAHNRLVTINILFLRLIKNCRRLNL